MKISKKLKDMIRKEYGGPADPGEFIPVQELEIGDEVEVILSSPNGDKEPETCPGIVIAIDDNGSPTIKLLEHRDPEIVEQN